MMDEYSKYLFSDKFDLVEDLTADQPKNPRSDIFCLTARSKTCVAQGSSVRDAAVHEALFFHLPRQCVDYIVGTCLGYKFRDFVNRVVERQRVPRFQWLATQITDAVLIAVAGSSMIHHFGSTPIADIEFPVGPRELTPAYDALLVEEPFYTQTLHILASDSQMRQYPENPAMLSTSLSDCFVRNQNCNVLTAFQCRSRSRRFLKNRSFLFDPFGQALDPPANRFDRSTTNSRRFAADAGSIEYDFSANKRRFADIQRFVVDFVGEFPRNQRTTFRSLVRKVAEMVIDVWSTNGLSTHAYFNSADIPQCVNTPEHGLRSHERFVGRSYLPHSGALLEDFVFGYGDNVTLFSCDDQTDMILTFINGSINRTGVDCFAFDYIFSEE